ncbi:hypothetical protein DWB85_19055 [Seongchinamella sediminis]|uniref:DUF1214 domain-containing protein n=2 Tax=Seongchinamella sediminis TaxID=2283635 RepID=A0A3L7DUA4_9GAMM|nr:hypothetical protein DWB85_19055 [Seongchinamella sediminis]
MAFSDDLNLAEATLREPQHYPPAPSERVMADGYRYLLAHLNREIEYAIRADPLFPEFFRSMDMLRKWTGENPDAMYLKAPIDASAYYQVEIQAENTNEWTAETFVSGAKAPRQVTFQTITSVPGYSGELKEMKDCRNQTLDFITGAELDADSLGRYRILIGPSRPDDYTGNFLLSRKRMSCEATGNTTIRSASMLSVREVFSDWEHEVPLDMKITRLDSIGLNRPPLSSSDLAAILETLGDKVKNQIRFWNLLMAGPMEMSGDTNNDGKRSLPINGINQPSPPFTAGGVAGAKQLYASGIFDLEDDEALIIRMLAPVEPYYTGFQLNNLWMEGPDQQNFVSSLTGAQNPVVGDQTRYYIISSQDPGVQGWIDTTGLKKGFHTMRFVFKESPSADSLPRLTAKRVKLSELPHSLPESYPEVSSDERKQQIAIRQDHIKMRWRNY